MTCYACQCVGSGEVPIRLSCLFGCVWPWMDGWIEKVLRIFAAPSLAQMTLDGRVESLPRCIFLRLVFGIVCWLLIDLVSGVEWNGFLSDLLHRTERRWNPNPNISPKTKRAFRRPWITLIEVTNCDSYFLCADLLVILLLFPCFVCFVGIGFGWFDSIRFDSIRLNVAEPTLQPHSNRIVDLVRWIYPLLISLSIWPTSSTASSTSFISSTLSSLVGLALKQIRWRRSLHQPNQPIQTLPSSHIATSSNHTQTHILHTHRPPCWEWILMTIEVRNREILTEGKRVRPSDKRGPACDLYSRSRRIFETWCHHCIILVWWPYLCQIRLTDYRRWFLHMFLLLLRDWCRPNRFWFNLPTTWYDFIFW